MYRTPESRETCPLLPFYMHFACAIAPSDLSQQQQQRRRQHQILQASARQISCFLVVAFESRISASASIFFLPFYLLSFQVLKIRNSALVIAPAAVLRSSSDHFIRFFVYESNK